MRFPRFSIRRLLTLTGLVALLLYCLLIRPVAIAKQFTHQIEASTDLASLSKDYFDGMDTDGAQVESYFKERTWADVLKGRQEFSISMVRPMPKVNDQSLVCVHRYSSTPLGIQPLDDPCLETRMKW